VFLATISASATPQVIVYEGTDWPETLGWTPTPFCDPPRTLVDGWFHQEVSPCPGDPLPGGQQESFKHDVAAFVGFGTFFLEWRAESTGPASEIIGVAPASIVAGGNFGTNYHFTFARDQIRLIRDNLLPILYHALVPGVPHTYRLELYGDDAYVLYINNELIAEGVPEGAYPQNDSAVISFRAKCWFEPSVTRWDYIRFGVVPLDASGDYDSDGAVTHDDFYFFHECLTNVRPGINGGPDNDAGPGCRFADFDADADTDLADFADFQNAFAAPE
jgi:hypothetical protein